MSALAFQFRPLTSILFHFLLVHLPNWPEKVKTMQKNWIGRSEGAYIMFSLENSPHLDKLEVFTTRPDTIFGMSFCAISPDHPLAKALSKDNEKIRLFLEECNSLSTDQASLEKLEKKGVKTSIEIKHPLKIATYLFT